MVAYHFFMPVMEICRWGDFEKLPPKKATNLDLNVLFFFYGLYQSKPPSNHHIWDLFQTFSKHLKQISLLKSFVSTPRKFEESRPKTWLVGKCVWWQYGVMLGLRMLNLWEVIGTNEMLVVASKLRQKMTWIFTGLLQVSFWLSIWSSRLPSQTRRRCSQTLETWCQALCCLET